MILTCITCKEPKEAEAFFRDTRRPSGRQSECRACGKARNSRWHKVNAATATPRIVANVNKQRRANPMKFILKGAKHRAKLAGLEFTITEADVVAPEFCPVLGIRMKSGLGTRRGNEMRDAAPSIDRIDNSRGYTPDNVVVVSLRANRLKSDATVEELEAVAQYYRRLLDARDRKGEGDGDTRSRRPNRLPNAMPRVLSEAEKEDRSVPARHDQGRVAGVVLSPLRFSRSDFR